MPFLRGLVVGWVSDEPQPGIIRVEMTDANGRRWTFEDKEAIFTTEPLSAESAYPAPIKIGCEILGREVRADGREAVRLTTARPWGIESVDGQTEFFVWPDELADTD